MKIRQNEWRKEQRKNHFSRTVMRTMVVHVFRFIGHHFHHFRPMFYRYPQASAANRIENFVLCHFLLSDYAEFLLLLRTHRSGKCPIASVRVLCEESCSAKQWPNTEQQHRLWESIFLLFLQLKLYANYIFLFYANVFFSSAGQCAAWTKCGDNDLLMMLCSNSSDQCFRKMEIFLFFSCLIVVVARVTRSMGWVYSSFW